MPRPGRMTTERAKDFKGSLLQLLRAMGKYKLSLIVVVVFAILSTIFNIAGPKILGQGHHGPGHWLDRQAAGHRRHRLWLHR